MKKNIDRIAKNLHIFAKAEIIKALSKYYSYDDSHALGIKSALMLQKWKNLKEEYKNYFREKAILILTK